MRHTPPPVPWRAPALAAGLLLLAWPARAQISSGTDVNLTKKFGDDIECAIAKNPTNKLQLFALCNTTGPGLAAARSTDGGVTWFSPDPSDGTIADGGDGQGAAAWCDPTLAWDVFGNLFIAYISASGGDIVTLLSTDGGATFTDLAAFGGGTMDQPTVVASVTTGPGTPSVWVVWNQDGQMVARGATVTGLGAVGAFNPLQTIPGTVSCSFGDIAVAPNGAVVQACQKPVGGEGPTTIVVNTDADGTGAGNFGAAVAATTTNVGGHDFIPAQPNRSVDAEAGLAYDANPASPTFGRLYLVYTDETVNENNDTDIMLRFSDTDGANWSAPVRVNTDPASPLRSQFLPRVATNRLSGNVAICWHDARNSATNTAMQEFCVIAVPATAGPSFVMPEALVSDGSSTTNGSTMDFGDYSGMAYFQGRVHPIWGDLANTTGDNPDGTANFDALSDVVSGGAAASEGDPHVTTIGGVHYDFQAAGDFVALRSGDGMEIQTRHTPVATPFTPGADPYDGIATAVSVNTAVAARVGSHRVTYQPNVSGVPDPGGLQLRVDGVLTPLGPGGVDLGDGGRVSRSPVGGIQIDFPNGTVLFVTPGWWTSQAKWYLNVNVFSTPATQGIMGALARGSWLPALPDGSSMGPMPPTVPARFAALYGRFTNAWRVSGRASLFDSPDVLVPGCNLGAWPRQVPACVPRGTGAVRRIEPGAVRTLCAPAAERAVRRDCEFDVLATGEREFARTYLLTRRLRAGGTVTVVTGASDWSPPESPVAFTAVVRGITGRRGGPAPGGAVWFTVDGERAGDPVRLDSTGRATWRAPRLPEGTHRVVASYVPAQGSTYLASSSPERVHVVRRANER